MRSKPPRVAGDAVYGPELPHGYIRLDTAAWFTWLEAPTTSSFSYPLFDPSCGYISGFMTVRKEGRQRGSAYWAVFRRDGRRVRKVYVGRSARVTQARLQLIAEQIRQAPEGGATGGSDG